MLFTRVCIRSLAICSEPAKGGGNDNCYWIKFSDGTEHGLRLCFALEACLDLVQDLYGLALEAGWDLSSPAQAEDDTPDELADDLSDAFREPLSEEAPGESLRGIPAARVRVSLGNEAGGSEDLVLLILKPLTLEDTLYCLAVDPSNVIYFLKLWLDSLETLGYSFEVRRGPGIIPEEGDRGAPA